MTREEAKSFLIEISYKLGNMSVEYLTEKDGEKMREAIEILYQEPCEDCISRQAVIDDLEKSHMTSGVHNQGTWNECVDSMIHTVRSMPSVNPQKTGHWIADVDKWGDIVTTVNGYRCDKCNTFNGYKDNYCPNCGAKMVEPKESEE